MIFKAISYIFKIKHLNISDLKFDYFPIFYKALCLKKINMV